MSVERIRTYCAMCISRCGVIATVDDGVFKNVAVDPDHPNGCICVKGAAAPEIVYSADRLRYPMVRTRPKTEQDPGWQRISWDEAMHLLAERLLLVKEHYGAEATVFGYATPRGSGTSDFSLWVQRLASAFGTPNILTSIHTCNWHREFGSAYTFGSAFPYPDYDNARCILLWGFNPERSWPGAAARISRAKARGAKIIVIDPRRTTGKADLWLRVRPGCDDVLAMSMIHVLLEEGLHDEHFVRTWTNAPFLIRDDTGRLLTERDVTAAGDPTVYLVWDEVSNRPVGYRTKRVDTRAAATWALSGTYQILVADGTRVQARPVFERLKQLAARYAPERSQQFTSVPAAEVRRTVRLFANEKPSCYFTWVGLEQHANATQMNRAISIFYALTGQFDRKGSNVLFGATPRNPVPGRSLLPKEQSVKRIGYSERPLGPSGTPGFIPGHGLYRSILDDLPYRVRALVMFGSDHLVADGEPLRGRAALQALDFYAHMDLFENPSARFADLLLPAASCWEREGLMPSFDVAAETANWVQYRQPVVPPRFESRPEVDVIFDLATRLGLGRHFFEGNVTAGLDYQLAPAELTVRVLKEHPMGIRANVETRYEKYAQIDGASGAPREFSTPTRKIEIYSTAFADAGFPPLPGMDAARDVAAAPREYPLALTFFRVLQFCDDAHRNVPRLRLLVPDPFVEIHPDTAAALDVQDGEWVVVETAVGQVRLKAKFNAFLDPIVVCTQYGWWQGCTELQLRDYDPFAPEGANANLLISNEMMDPISGSVAHRSQMCRVRKIPADALSTRPS